MSNVLKQEIPISFLNAIQRQENILRSFSLSKGSSENLYIIITQEEDKEIFKIVSYGKLHIKEFIKNVYCKPKEELKFSEQCSLQKLHLFIKTLFEDYNADIVEIDGKKLFIGNDIDEFLQSIVK